MKSRGFTLTELTVVLLIIAIAAAAVALDMQAPLANAQMRDVVGAIAGFDRATRTACREQDRPLGLMVDLSAGRIRRADRRGRPMAGREVALPDGLTIQRVMVRTREIDVGRVVIPCSGRGLTPTYAILLAGRGGRQWLVVAGLTGQLVRVDDDSQVREIMAATVARRHAG